MNPTCKGSYMLGTACASCERCREEAKRLREDKQPPKGTFTDKWYGKEADFNHALATVRLAIKEYSKNIFDCRDDVTRRQASDEFWQRIAEAEGFIIKFNREG